MPEDIYKIYARNPKTGEEKDFTAKHDNNWAKRNGYSSDFLGAKIELPNLTDYPDREHLAMNSNPGVNGQYAFDYSNFSLVFNKAKKLPVFTAVNIKGPTNALAMVHEERGTDKWYLDGRIKDGDNYFQYTNNDYRGSNLQKGHMVRFYDPAWSSSDEKKAIAIGDTFHYTNACPQVGKYNAGIWNDLEDYYMARAIFEDRKITVFTGPLLSGAKKLNGMLVPMSFWKILIYTSNHKISAMAFLITHKVIVESLEKENLIIEELVKPTLKDEDIARLYKKLKQWRVKISLIEEKTNLRFGLSQYDVFKDQAESYYIEKLALLDKPLYETFTKSEDFIAHKKELDEDIALIKTL